MQHQLRHGILSFCTIIFFLSIFTMEIDAQIFHKVQSCEASVPRGRTFGTGWIDFNSDGYLDLICNNYDTPDNLYINNKNGTFTLSTALSTYSIGSYFSGITWGDCDNNGYNDLFLTTLQGGNELLMNLGDGHFQRVTNSPVNTASDIHLHATWFDYDNDGWLDLLVPTVSSFNFARGGGTASHFYMNNGNGTFTKSSLGPVTATLGNHQCANVADYDNDGDLDVFMTDWQADNVLFENNGDGTFTPVTGSGLTPNTLVSMNCAWGDYDNDGWMDLFVGSGTGDNTRQLNQLYHNNGDKTFTKITTGDIATIAGCTWTAAWGDVDNDGDLDLVTGDLVDANAAYINDGKGNFTKTNIFDVASSGASGIALGDYDNDGFLDLYVAEASNLGNTLYHNQGNSNNWIMITCKGVASNRSAIGARVRVKATIAGVPVWQTREVNTNQGFRSVSDIRVHFGLGDATVIDSLVIDWPSKIRTVKTGVAAKQFLTVTEELPAGFLMAAFTADTLTGNGVRTIRFTDRSIAASSTPITSWAWDFNGDGVAESTEQNPTYTFTALEGASFPVSLTVSNGSRTEKRERKDFIQIQPMNYSVGNAAAASSYSTAQYAPGNVCDGNLGTRWLSAQTDTSWIRLDLDSTVLVNKVILRWHVYYGKSYLIQTSLDSLNWTTVFQKGNGSGGTEEIVFPAVEARYIRLYGTHRATRYGYSLYEFEVYRTQTTGIEEYDNLPRSFRLEQNYPNPFNPTTKISFSLEKQEHVTLRVFDLLGREVGTLVHRVLQPGTHTVAFTTENLPSGVYFYRLQTADRSDTKKMVLLR